MLLEAKPTATTPANFFPFTLLLRSRSGRLSLLANRQFRSLGLAHSLARTERLVVGDDFAPNSVGLVLGQRRIARLNQCIHSFSRIFIAIRFLDRYALLLREASLFAFFARIVDCPA